MGKVIYQDIPLEKKISQEITQQLIASNDLLRRGLALPENDVKTSKTLRKYDAEFDITDPSAVFNAQTSDETIDGNDLTVKKMAVMKLINFEDAYKYMQNPPVAAGDFADYESPEIMDAIVQAHGKKLTKRLNRLDILGKQTSDAYLTFTGGYTGLIPALIADTTTNTFLIDPIFTITGITKGATTTLTHASGANDNVEVGDVITLQDNITGIVDLRGLSGSVLSKTGTTTVLDIDSSAMSGTFSGTATAICINKSNVISVFQKAKNVTDDAVLDEMPVYYVPSRVKRAYEDALSELFNNSPVGEKANDYMGFKVEGFTDFLPNCIMLALPNNIRIGYDDEEMVIEVFWEGARSRDKVYSLRIEMKRGVQYVRGEEITILKPAKATL